jgi:hypothetical protein
MTNDKEIERKAFEKWARDEGYCLAIYPYTPCISYKDDDTANAWAIWQAALDAIRPVNQEMLEALKQTYAYLWENKYPSVTTDISNDKAQALEWKKQQGVK